MAIALDAGFPVSSNFTIGSASSLASGSITTPGTNRLLVAVCSWYIQSGANAIAPVTMSGAGLTWTLLVEKSFNDVNGSSSLSVWWAVASSTLTSQTITVTRTGSDTATGSCLLDIYSLTGAATTQSGTTGGAVASASTATHIAISPAAGSWLFWSVVDAGSTRGGAAIGTATSNTSDNEVDDAIDTTSVKVGRWTGAAPGGSITVGTSVTADTNSGIAAGEIQAGAANTQDEDFWRPTPLWDDQSVISVWA